MTRFIFLFLCCCLYQSLQAQSPRERAIPISSQWIAADSLLLSWPFAIDAQGPYSIFKSNPLTGETPQLVTQQVDTSFSDFLAQGELLEYFVYQSDPFPFRDTFPILAADYSIKVEDEFNKGLCCNFGNGYFQLSKANGELIFSATDFGKDTTWIYQSPGPDTLYLEIRSDLFGDHLQYELRDTLADTLVTAFGPFGNYRQSPPTYGTVWIGNDYEHVAEMGDLLILVADNLIDSLSAELNAMQEDLVKLGYRVLLKSMAVEVADSIVRDSIQDWFINAPGAKTLYLIGHVAVPYSGDIYPDTHSENHKGAWSADGFYGVDSSLWSDTLVNETSAFFDRNKNIPGDGKWDQSTFPGNVDIKIGRVDLSDLEAFEKNEIELTREYLQKAQAWRRGEIASVHRGLIDDNFDDQFGAPAANGYRNLWNLLGYENVEEADFSTELNANTYLWAYSCGSGTHVSSAGVSSTAEIAEDSLQGIFLMSFGSQFGDWDNGNNFLRAPLASGTVLTNMWVGNPHIDYREMGLGFPIGNSIQRNMNRPAGLHENGPVMVHLGLMGDPTLDQYPIAAASNLSIKVQMSTLDLAWNQSASPYLFGYDIYRSDSLGVDWELLTTEAISDTTFIDENPLEGINQYNVFAIGHIENNSGRFYKRSMPINALDTFIIINPTQEITLKDQWEIYPNPAEHSISINYSGWADSSAPEYLINVLGQYLPVNSVFTGQQAQIDVADLPAGLYYYQKGGITSPMFVVK